MNSNCLAGMRCPDCGSEGPFEIAVKALARMTDDGCETVEDIEWTDASPVECVGCKRVAPSVIFRGGRSLGATEPMQIPAAAWDDWGTEGQSRARSRLGTMVDINACWFHAEAIEVVVDESGTQRAADGAWQSLLDEYGVAAGGDGRFSSVQIEGRSYAVFLSPFCE